LKDSDHFIYACQELSIHVSMLFSALLIHGRTLSDICASTVISIPKGKNVNIADSCNYRGISLCSVFAKLFDLTFLDKFCDCLTTSDLQFGFEKKHSTSMCTMALK